MTKTGRKAVLKASIHCIEPIPCNPCETSCPFNAISVGADITALPVIDTDACRGCGICLAVCPGLAIRMVEQEEAGREGEADKLTVAFPYEYLDLPSAGDSVTLVDMDGNPLGSGRVSKIHRPLRDDPTPLVHVRTAASIAPLAWSMKI